MAFSNELRAYNLNLNHSIEEYGDIIKKMLDNEELTVKSIVMEEDYGINSRYDLIHPIRNKDDIDEVIKKNGKDITFIDIKCESKKYGYINIIIGTSFGSCVVNTYADKECARYIEEMLK